MVCLLGDHAVIKFVDKETLLKEKQQQSEVFWLFCPDFFLILSLILVLWACWLFNFSFVCFRNKKRNENKKEEAKKKLEAEKVSNNDFHLPDNFGARRALVVKWQICINFSFFFLYFSCFFRLLKKPKPEFLHGKCLKTKQTSILNLMSRSESLNKSFLSFKLRH